MATRKRDETLYSTIGCAIERLRTQRKLSQAQLAAKSQLTRTSLVHIERGQQRLPIDRLYMVADALGVSVYSLLPDSRPVAKPAPQTSSVHISDSTQKRVEDLLNKYGGTHDRKKVSPAEGSK
jgi:transcriptional regulator with XRE-family HTH domain